MDERHREDFRSSSMIVFTAGTIVTNTFLFSAMTPLEDAVFLYQ